jgi:cysteine desulfuration protein SufE
MTDPQMTLPRPSPQAALEDLAETLDFLGDWEERYKYIIDLGRALPRLEESQYCDSNKVQGCASQVWLVVDSSNPESLSFRGDSDAHIVKGLVAVLMHLLSGVPRDTIVQFDLASALKRLGLSEALSSQRTNGLMSMAARIQAEARATRTG